MRVSEWGKGLAVRLPAVVVEALKLKEGDEIEIHIVDGRQFGVARKPERGKLLKRLRASVAVSVPISSSTGMRRMPVSFSTPMSCSISP